LRLSLGRRLACDLMDVSQAVPSVMIARRMPLAVLAEAREQSQPRPGWCAIFVKAFAAVAARFPELRRGYFAFPWPHLYEHPHSLATVGIERSLGDEPALFFGQIEAPERQPLGEIDARLRRYKEAPVESIGAFRRALRIAALPRPFRIMLWWFAGHTTGPRRAHYLGTFGVSSVAAHGSMLQLIRSPLTATLTYGRLEEDGTMEVQLSIDPRVLDGGEAARALEELERVLRGEILAELRYLHNLDAA
jgi:hypothetical protein